MAAGNNSQAIAAQIEWTRNELEPLMLMSSVLWKRINTKTDVKPVSNRPCRIPFNPATVLRRKAHRAFKQFGESSGIVQSREVGRHCSDLYGILHLPCGWLDPQQ